MKTIPESEPAKQVLKAANYAGFSVSSAQLTRWHRQGLLPSPGIQWLGKGKGTRTVYPEGTSRQLIALCRIHATEHRLPEVGWRLWWHGYPVANRYSIDVLKAAAASFDSTMQVLRSLEKTGDAGPNKDLSISDVLDKHFHDRKLPSALRAVRKRVGNADFETVVRIAIQVAQGRFGNGHEGFDEAEDEKDIQIFERGTGLAHARRSGPLTTPAMLSGPIVENLRELSVLFRSLEMSSFLAQWAEQDIAAQRDQLRDIVACFAVMIYAAKMTFPALRNLFGVKQLTEMVERGASTDQALLLLGYGIVTRSPLFSGGPIAAEAARGALTAFERAAPVIMEKFRP